MVSRNPEIHYRPYIRPPLIPIFSKNYPISRNTTHLPQIHFNIILSSTFGLPKGLFPSGFPTKTLYEFLDYSIRTTFPAHLSRLNLRFLIMLGEEYNACSSTLCNFLNYHVVSSLFVLNIFLSTLFSSTLVEPGGPMVIILVIGSEIHEFKPGRGLMDFSERKNPEYDFLRKGSKAVGPVT